MVPYALADMKENFLPWKNLEVVVMKDGSVTYVPNITMKKWCKVNYDNWPFGEQVRNIKSLNIPEILFTFAQ